MQKALLLSNLNMLGHENSAGLSHPENPKRLQSIFDKLSKSNRTVEISNRMITRDELKKIHTPAYIDSILSQRGQTVQLDDETSLATHSVDAACLAAGISLDLVDRIAKGEVQKGFALVRPPGHHARPDSAMGFCIFNNLALAVRHAQSLGYRRILILDWDVHHGNGTQEAFYQDNDVLVIDIHQDSLFPSGSGTLEERGEGNGTGFTVNVPLPPFFSDPEYFLIMNKIVKPLAAKFKPDWIFISAGFDAEAGDPLGGMEVTSAGFAALTTMACALADEYAQGRLTMILEGGYDLVHLPESVKRCVEALDGVENISAANTLPAREECEAIVTKIWNKL